MIEIDVRTMPPRERHPRIFQTFDELAPGAALLLVNDHDPKPLLFTFQRQLTGRYDWSYLEEGPETFRVRIGRRASSRDGVLAVGDLMGFDHDRLDVLLAEVGAAAAESAWSRAGEIFATFRVGLARHIRAEEEVLFPAFDRIAGTPPDAGPAAVMRSEHRDIERIMNRVAGALGEGQPPPLEDLVAVLAAHNRKEEHVLYPMVDDRLDDMARARLCLDLEAV